MILDTENDPEALLFHAVCENAVVTDLLETCGQDVLQEPADEFHVRDGDMFHIPRVIVFRPEGHSLIGNGFDPGVGDRDPVGVTSKIIYGVAKAVEGFLYKGAPVFPVEAVTERSPVLRLFKGTASGGKDEPAVFVKAFEGIHELPAE